MEIGSCNSLSPTSFRTSNHNHVNLHNIASGTSANRLQMRTSEPPQQIQQTQQTQPAQQPTQKYTHIEISKRISFKNSTSGKDNFSSSFITDAVLAEFPYTGNAKLVEETAPDWNLSTKLSLLTNNSNDKQQNLPARFKSLNETGIRTKSGMVAYLFENDKSKNTEMRLVFGGTTSGKNYGNFLERNVSNFKDIVAQWGSNVKNLFGAVPNSYNDAYELLVALRAEYPKANIVTSGHSLGGAEACYAAMKVNALDLSKKQYEFKMLKNITVEAKENFILNMVKSVNFSTAKLGKAAQKDIADEIMHVSRDSNHKNYTKEEKKNILDHAFEILSQGVTHIYIKGDKVPELGTIAGAKHFGDVTVVNINNPSITGLSEHINFRKHLMS